MLLDSGCGCSQTPFSLHRPASTLLPFLILGKSPWCDRWFPMRLRYRVPFSFAFCGRQQPILGNENGGFVRYYSSADTGLSMLIPFEFFFVRLRWRRCLIGCFCLTPSFLPAIITDRMTWIFLIYFIAYDILILRSMLNKTIWRKTFLLYVDQLWRALGNCCLHLSSGHVCFAKKKKKKKKKSLSFSVYVDRNVMQLCFCYSLIEMV